MAHSRLLELTVECASGREARRVRSHPARDEVVLEQANVCSELTRDLSVGTAGSEGGEKAQDESAGRRHYTRHPSGRFHGCT